MNPTFKLIVRLAYALLGLLGLLLVVVAGWAFVILTYDNPLLLAMTICLVLLVISLLVSSVRGKYLIVPPALAVALVLLNFADIYAKKESTRKFCQTTYESCQADPNKDQGLCNELEREYGLARVCRGYIQY